MTSDPVTKLPLDELKPKPGQNEPDYLNSTKDYYFLDEHLVQEQVESLHAFITHQMQSNNTVTNTKINITALGFPDLSAFRQIFSGFGDTIKRDAVCSGCQVFLGLLSHQVCELRLALSEISLINKILTMFQIKFHRSSQSNLISFSTFTCNFFRLAAPEVCVGVLERWVLVKHLKISRISVTDLNAFLPFLQTRALILFHCS